MSKFKVGEKVIIKEGLVPESRVNGVYVNPSMVRYGGKVVTIRETDATGFSKDNYRMEEIDWNWDVDMLIPANKFKVGDIVRGNADSDDRYGITNSKMTKGKIVKVDDSRYIEVEVLEHEYKYHVGSTFGVCSDYFELVPPKTHVLDVGDVVWIRPDLEYGSYGGESFVDGMEVYRGKKTTITELASCGGYFLDIDDGEFYWSNEMLSTKPICKFKVGDIIKGTKEANCYTWTDEHMIGEVVEVGDFNDDRDIKVKILEPRMVGEVFPVVSSRFELFPKAKFEVGDLVRGTDAEKYGYTNTNMTLGIVVEVADFGCGDDIKVKIIKHKTCSHQEGYAYEVNSKYFTKVKVVDAEE